MTRQTRIKFAAIATAIVATLGVAAIAPATADNAGKSHVTNMRDGEPLLLTRLPCGDFDPVSASTRDAQLGTRPQS